VKNVCEKCNVTITKENISSRSKTFDKHYNIINGLLSTSGFGWDWEKNKLKVDSDTVWDEYVEVRKFSTLYCTLKFSVLLSYTSMFIILHILTRLPHVLATVLGFSVCFALSC
jgi:hypothetical protein